MDGLQFLPLFPEDKGDSLLYPDIDACSLSGFKLADTLAEPQAGSHLHDFVLLIKHIAGRQLILPLPEPGCHGVTALCLLPLSAAQPYDIIRKCRYEKFHIILTEIRRKNAPGKLPYFF